MSAFSLYSTECKFIALPNDCFTQNVFLNIIQMNLKLDGLTQLKIVVNVFV